MMKEEKLSIGFFGAGRVGVSLGRYFYAKNQKISGYYSRNTDNARMAAELTKSKLCSQIGELVSESDIIFVTVSDSALSEVWRQIKSCGVKNKILCHCSGALSSDIFEDAESLGAYAYSVHPIFAINDKESSYKELHKAFFTIQGSAEKIGVITGLFDELNNPYKIIDSAQKCKYHAALATASNLVIGLYHMSARLLCECGFSGGDAEAALNPLFLNNAVSLTEKGCAAALTGPVDRNDILTVEKHLAALDGSERIKDAYKALSSELILIAKEKYPFADYEKLEMLLKVRSR